MRAAFALAVPLGLVAALNPCAFPLLPGYLVLFARDGSAARTSADAARRALIDGAAMTAAFVAVFCSVGALASAVLAPLTAVAPGALLALGVLLVAGAALTAAGRAPRLPLPARFPGGTSVLAAAGFGVVYAAGSLGCALPLFLAAMGGAVAVGGWAPPLAACAGYALGMGLMVTAVGVVAASAGARAGRRLGAAGRLVGPLGVAVQALSGLGLAAVGMRDLGVPAPVWLLSAQAAVTGWIDRDAAAAGGGLGAVVLVAVVAAAVASARSARAATE